MNVGMCAGELSYCLHSPESEHRALPSSEGKMTVLGPVVVPSAHLATIEIPQFAHGGGVGFEPVGDDSLGRAVPLQRLLHEGECC